MAVKPACFMLFVSGYPLNRDTHKSIFSYMAGKETHPFLARLNLLPGVRKIVEEVVSEGGRAYLVGGYVRDIALGRESKDLDVEVHCLDMDKLEQVLGRFGAVDLVGKQFGVLRVRGIDVDWSVPRRDSKGRHPRVETDPWMGIDEASRRRDLTVNAMSIDPIQCTLHDPFNGLDDLNAGVLRAPDPDLFVEDPLRFFRVMAFAGRLGMRPDPELSRLCAGMDLSGVARERIEDEFAKLLLKSSRPSLGFRWLESIGCLPDVLPEAAPLVGLKQEPGWHPEGDVWEHTMQVLDAAAALRIDDRDEDLVLLWAAFCHDLGKAGTTAFLDGRIRSPGHTELSGRLARKLMSRYVSSRKVVEGAAKLSESHLAPHDFYVNNAGPKAFKRLALRLAPETSLDRLAALALADYRGRNAGSSVPLGLDSEECAWFLEQAEKLKVEREPEKPALMGRHLLDLIEPGPRMGRLLDRAYEIQLSEGITDQEVLKERVLEEEKAGEMPDEE